MLSAIYRDDEVIVSIDGSLFVVPSTSEHYSKVLLLLMEQNKEALLNVLSTKKKAAAVCEQLEALGFKNIDGTYYYKSVAIQMDLSKYLVDAIERGTSIKPIVNFISKLFSNPNFNTRQQLFSFMQRNSMPIEEDGCFLAYKVVRSDYLDKHTGTMSNAPGTVVEVDWAAVDTDPTRTCSQGLHCCALEYCSAFYSQNDRIIVVKVNPADVGAVPIDYNGSKLRTRAYTVVNDITDKWVSQRERTRIASSSGLNAYHSKDNPLAAPRTFF